MCCLAKEHAENMENPSPGALLFVKFNKRLFARVRRVVSMVNELCAQAILMIPFSLGLLLTTQ